MTSIKQQLDTMLRRSLALCGHDYNEKGERVGKHEAVQGFLKTLAANTTSAREMADQIIAAWDDNRTGGGGKLQAALNAARVEQIGNFIAAESTFKSAFFSTVTLQPDEEPFYVNETKNEVRVGTVGDDGTPEQVRVVRPQERTAVGLYTVASDIVKVKTQDIYRGDVSQSALATLDIARDITFKVDRIHYNLLNAAIADGGCYGAFSTEQARSNKATRIYVAHSGVVTANLPTTNAVVNGTVGGSGGTRWTVQYYDPPYATDGTTLSDYTGLRPAVLMAILDYADSWGSVLPGGGRLVPTGEIIVPSIDCIGYAQYAQITNINVDMTRMQQEVEENGYTMVSFMGKSWKFIPDVTLATGTCYPRFNLLPGISYEKPSWSKQFTKMDEAENWESRWQRQAYGCVLPSQYRPRGLKITYAAA